MKFRFLMLSAMLFTVDHMAAAQMVDKKAMTLQEAQKIAVAAEDAAVKNHLRESIAILDDGGNLLVFYRMDNAQLAGVAMAQGKARTALFFQGPSKAFADRIDKGQINVLDLPGLLPADGGLPLTYRGQLVGAIGVSGATPTQDGQIAEAGAAALQ